MKILNTIKNFHPDARAILEKLGDVSYVQLSQKELEQKISEYDILVVGLGLRVDLSALRNARSLKIIATPTTGLDHVDMEATKEKGVEVLSLRGEEKFLRSITGTAELAFGLLFSLVRNIPHACDDVKSGNWRREQFSGNTLYGKILGIVGLGRLGTMVARYGQSFGTRVIAYDPYKQKNNTKDVLMVPLERLLAESDIISIGVHLSDDTEHMFSKKEFKAMKPSAVLINTSRGKIVDEKALLEALQAKEFFGYATDVLAGEIESEWSPAKDPLVRYAKENNNVIITPHIGGMTHESRRDTDIFIAKKITEYAK